MGHLWLKPGKLKRDFWFPGFEIQMHQVVKVNMVDNLSYHIFFDRKTANQLKPSAFQPAFAYVQVEKHGTHAHSIDNLLWHGLDELY